MKHNYNAFVWFVTVVTFCALDGCANTGRSKGQAGRNIGSTPASTVAINRARSIAFEAIRRGDLEGAIITLRAEAAIRPYGDNCFVLAVLEMKTGHTTEALRDFHSAAHPPQNVFASSVDNSYYLVPFGDLSLLNGNEQEARASYFHIAKNDSNPRRLLISDTLRLDSPLPILRAHAYASLYNNSIYQADQPSEARKLARLAVSLAPADPWIRALYAESLGKPSGSVLDLMSQWRLAESLANSEAKQRIHTRGLVFVPEHIYAWTHVIGKKIERGPEIFPGRATTPSVPDPIKLGKLPSQACVDELVKEWSKPASATQQTRHQLIQPG